MTSYQNITNNLTRKLILSFPNDPHRPDADEGYLQLSPYGKHNAAGVRDYIGQPEQIVDAAPTMEFESVTGSFWHSVEKPNHWQDTISPYVMSRTLGGVAAPSASSSTGSGTSPTDQRSTTDPILANEFEIDASMITHTFQSLTSIAPLPGIKKTGVNSKRVTEQLNALSIDLGMMREVISVQGIIIDRRVHPSSTSNHHLRRQHLLDMCRAQYSMPTMFQSDKDRAWLNINKFPALTIGPMIRRDAGNDTTYEGDQPSNDVRGREHKGSNGYNWQQDRHARGTPAKTSTESFYAALPITALSAANPTVITTGSNHGLEIGDTVSIENTNSTPPVFGTYEVTSVPSATTFSINYTVTSAGDRGIIINHTALFNQNTFGASTDDNSQPSTSTPPASTTISSSWDPTPTYRGRHRYRGMINRVSVTNQGGRPDIWQFSMEFVVLKNEMQMRQIDTG